MPRYLGIALELRREIQNGQTAPGVRLPSERSLAQRFAVNRQTVRSALQKLREEGIVVTEKRGTFAAAMAAPQAGPEQTVPLQFPGSAEGFFGSRTRSRLSYVTVPPELSQSLGLRPGEPTLVHRHRTVAPDGEFVQDAVSYFTPVAVSQIPELARYRARLRPNDADLRLFYQWMDRAGLQPNLRESITLSRAGVPTTGPGHALLHVRRHVRDQHGRLHVITVLSFTPSWQELEFEFAGTSAVTSCRR